MLQKYILGLVLNELAINNLIFNVAKPGVLTCQWHKTLEMRKTTFKFIQIVFLYLVIICL